jgi:hypothetical protein
MRLRTRHRRNTGADIIAVERWGPEPIGAAQVEGVMARAGALLAGFTRPTPAGWGLTGSQELTDQSVWASPQAFTGAGAKVALAAFTVGADAPTVYPQDAHSTGIVLPGRGGV